VWVLAVLEGELGAEVLTELWLTVNGLDNSGINLLLEGLDGVVEWLLLLCGSKWAILALLLGGLWLLEHGVVDLIRDGGAGHINDG